MDLKNFVKQTLLEITGGLKEANHELKGSGADFILPQQGPVGKEGTIVFDVAVTVTSEDSKTGGGGIKIAVVNLGGELKGTEKHESISRIKFSISPYTFIR